MIIPVRCFSCGGLIAHKWEEFNEKKEAGTDVMTALDELGFDLYCCRRMFVSHIDLISEVAPFSAPRERAQSNQIPQARACGLAWPILGGWGPSDPSSNLGRPTAWDYSKRIEKRVSVGDSEAMY